MPKTLKFTLLLTLIFLLTGLILVPEALILAYDGRFGLDSKISLIDSQTAEKGVNSISGGFSRLMEQAKRPWNTDWRGKIPNIAKVLKFEEFKNFAQPLIDTIGKIKNSVLSFINKFTN